MEAEDDALAVVWQPESILLKLTGHGDEGGEGRLLLAHEGRAGC